jgi:hypothetical protein
VLLAAAAVLFGGSRRLLWILAASVVFLAVSNGLEIRKMMLTAEHPPKVSAPILPRRAGNEPQ